MRKSPLPLVPNHLHWLVSLHCKYNFWSRPPGAQGARRTLRGLPLKISRSYAPSFNSDRTPLQCLTSPKNKAVWTQDQAGNFPWQVHFWKSPQWLQRDAFPPSWKKLTSSVVEYETHKVLRKSFAKGSVSTFPILWDWLKCVKPSICSLTSHKPLGDCVKMNSWTSNSIVTLSRIWLTSWVENSKPSAAMISVRI